MKFHYKLKKAPLLLIALLSSAVGLAQNVGINSSGSNPSADAMLDVSSTTKGLLIPRVSIASLTTIAPITGGSTESLIVYNTNAGTGKGYYYWDGAKWNRLYDQTVNGSDHDWYEVGGTTAPNSINDDVYTQGDVGVGIAAPLEKLHVNGNLRVASIINSSSDHLSLMYGVRSNDNSYEWTGFYSGTTRQGIILYDGSWGGANSLTNEFGITAENGNKLTLNTTGNSDVALMPDGTGKVGILTTSPTAELTVNGWIGRTAHNNGALAGSYNNVGSNSAQTNPIYVIGTNYKPATTTLSNMYGIGYSHTNSSYITDPGPDTWGMYVAADGDARIWFGASASGISYFDAGYVGIGLQNPTNKLHVEDNAVGASQSVIYGRNNNTAAGVSYAIRGVVNSTAIGSAGVIGESSNSGQNETGVIGDYSLWGAGVLGLGWATTPANMPVSKDYGVFGSVNYSTGTGVYGYNLNTGGSAYGVYCNGNFAVTGAKAASVPTSQGNQMVYCVEGPEMWFDDYGTVKLINGTKHVDLEEMFLETVFIDDTHPMHVFLQEQGECNGLYFIPDVDHKGFTIKEKSNGNSNISVSFRIMGKRRFYQDHRFGIDASQPLEDNLSKAKYNEPSITNLEVMRAYIAEQNKEKEALRKEEEAQEKIEKENLKKEQEQQAKEVSDDDGVVESKTEKE